eukprot:CAMPEP_0117560702 /NCGR_PEP_ID=MMETSP0784-20121206/54011_1 /TAXON_ID=39447 /ORGANISM="" /LENGTH=328 /DNA_ID=CAMNT_0005358117 /DNA_START=193 /DNA_END=1179 /DNA_ORIENTATION=+
MAIATPALSGPGSAVCGTVAFSVGAIEGASDVAMGTAVKEFVGNTVGRTVRRAVGRDVVPVGVNVEDDVSKVGSIVGLAVGISVGSTVGRSVGANVGANVAIVMLTPSAEDAADSIAEPTEATLSTVATMLSMISVVTVTFVAAGVTSLASSTDNFNFGLMSLSVFTISLGVIIDSITMASLRVEVRISTWTRISDAGGLEMLTLVSTPTSPKCFSIVAGSERDDSIVSTSWSQSTLRVTDLVDSPTDKRLRRYCTVTSDEAIPAAPATASLTNTSDTLESMIILTTTTREMVVEWSGASFSKVSTAVEASFSETIPLPGKEKSHDVA